ncbi:MAG: hypothetical protein COA79_12000 [Planctomycetota bacterium]|nr:MAG: hypothetical protein COA79_12000 [Planctomycetota bacterium]
MNIFSIFRKKPKKSIVNLSFEKCSKINHIGEELKTLIHPKIDDVLKANYQEEIELPHFIDKKENAKSVFEAACIGSSIVDLITLIEHNQLESKLVNECLTYFKEIYGSEETGCIYNHAMKYLQEYKSFKESPEAEKINDEDLVKISFTGAWIIRYYLGNETTIYFESSLEMGRKVNDQIKNIWLAETN